MLFNCNFPRKWYYNSGEVLVGKFKKRLLYYLGVAFV